MEELSKTQLKLTKIIVKYCPIIIAACYFLSVTTSCFGLGAAWTGPIYYMSLIPFICLIACSKLLKFCIWHRLPLYYSALIDIINAIDFYFVIPIANKWMLLIYLLITGVFIIIGTYLKEKYNKNKREH